MLNIRRLLFPTDFSEGSRRAFPQAATFAARHDADLHILHVASRHRHESKPEEFPIPPDTLDDWLSTGLDGKNHLDVEALSITQKQVVSRSPSEQIRGCVEAENINLVVMSTHDRHGLDRMLLGSVTTEVLRTAPCPILTVRPDLRVIPDPVVRRILVPIDVSAASETALQNAEEIALTYGAELNLLHTVEKTVYSSAYGAESASASMMREGTDRTEQSLSERLHDDLNSERVTIRSTTGYPPAAILDYVENNEIDLVVTATNGSPDTDRIRLDRVAERIIRRSPAPVFTVKPSRTSSMQMEKTRADVRD